MPTGHTLQKAGHRLISTPNLDLHECCLHSIAPRLGTLHLRLLRIIPLARSTEDIFSLFAREVFALVHAGRERVGVGASLAG